MAPKAPDMFENIQGSPINYAASFNSNAPRLAKEALRPYKKPLGPDTYDASIGLDHTNSIGWRQISEIEREISCFQSQEPRFKETQSMTGGDVGPGKYDDIRLPSCADIKDQHHGNYMFQSKVPLSMGKKEVVDNRDTNWSQEVDKKKFWGRTGAVWTKTPRSKMGPRINSSGCGPDVVMYEVDATRVVNKYVPLSKAAGCDKVALPPRARKPGSVTPRSKFLVDQATASAPPLDFSFLQLETTNDIVRAVEELGMKTPRKGPEVPEEKNASKEPKKPPSTPQVVPRESDNDSGKMVVKKIVTSVRLNNNQLKVTEGLQEALVPAVDNPDKIAWIDLAHNQLTSICAEDFLPSFKNVAVLNLDSNDIYKLSDINKLVPFSKLTSLTLHSNPVTLSSHYRWYVISSLPQLKKLDSCIITPLERQRANMWRTTLKKGQVNVSGIAMDATAPNTEQVAQEAGLVAV